MSRPTRVYHNIRVLVPRVEGVTYEQAVAVVNQLVQERYLDGLSLQDISAEAFDAARLALVRSAARASSAWGDGGSQRP